MFPPFFLHHCLTSGFQTVIMKQELRASIVFSSMTVFDLLRDQLYTAFFLVSNLVAGKVSLDRVDDFLKNVCFFYVVIFLVADKTILTDRTP